MSKIENLHAGDMAELLSFLNLCFTGDPNSRHFENGLPKMWVDDEAHMRQHYVIRENGRLAAAVGVYPFTVNIAGEDFTFATVGNMGVAPEFRGKGYLNELYLNANRVLSEMGADVARLGGLRSRYDRYGYEPCGFMAKFTLTTRNAKEYIKRNDAPELEFKPVTQSDTEELAAIRRLYAENGCAADRGGDRELYLTLIFSQNTPYAAKLDGRTVGYFTVKGDWICESHAETPELHAAMLCRYVMNTDTWCSLHIPVDRPECIRLFCSFCEHFHLDTASHYKIMNWARLTTALMRLKARFAPLSDGSMILGIEGYGNFLLKVENGIGLCEATDKEVELSLTANEASRFLFGTLPPYVGGLKPATAAFAAANLPLPLYTHYHDKTW